MSKKTYTTQEVADLCGVSFSVIISYEKTGYVLASGRPAGHGARRHWTPNEMRWCVAITVLRPAFKAEFLRDIARFLEVLP